MLKSDTIPTKPRRKRKRTRRKPKPDALPPDHHLLQSPWTLRYKELKRYTGKKEQNERSWLSLFKHVYICESVENFWGMWTHSIASNEAIGTFTLFRDGIDPSQEHPKNYDGCALYFYIEEGLKFSEFLTLSLIGEIYDNEASGINGVIIDIKPSKEKASGYVWKISLWLERDKVTSAPLIKQIKEDMKEFVDQLDHKKDIKLWNHK